MGIDPKTHEPSSSPSGLLKRLPASPSTRHMAQWESARLEAEARLSRESSFSIPSSTGNLNTDYILRLWNSEIGESFRNFNIKGNKIGRNNSSISLASSSTKCESVSVTAPEGGVLGLAGASAAGSNQTEDPDCKSSISPLADVHHGSDSAGSDDLEDSSESTLQLLLDFPNNNDMSFLGHCDHNNMYSLL